MRIKIEIQNKLYIWLNREIKNRNQFSKEQEKIKRMRIKIDIKIKNKF